MKRLIKRNGFVKRILQIAMAVAIMVSPLLMIAKPNKSVYARKNDAAGEATRVLVSSINNEGNINGTNFVTLLQRITNSTVTTLTTDAAKEALFNKLLTESQTPKTSEDFRGYTANGGLDVNVMFGDLEWTVTYLSQDKFGNPIATLWLSNYPDIISTLISRWSDDWYAGNPTDDYPSNMYGASYIRARLNGGSYVTGYSSADDSTRLQDYTATGYDHYTISTVGASDIVYTRFASFTTGNLAKYITTPSSVAWQEFGQYSKGRDLMWSSSWQNLDYNLPNENWGEVPSTDFYENMNYYGKVVSADYEAYNISNNAWKDDKIWLPSIYEVGSYDADSTHLTANGLWKTREVQRDFYAGYWLRSGYVNNSSAIYWNAPGGSTALAIYGSANDYSARPALHLNLRYIAQQGGIPTPGFPNTGVSGTISAVIIVAVGVMLLVILVSYAMITTKPKRIVR